MARIRTIKPEFWTSEQVMECSPMARLLFIGIWNFCDDAGNHPLSAKTIKALIFPGDEITTAQVDAMLGELQSNDLITAYEASAKQYLHVNGWGHQKIDKPTYKHPSFVDRSPSTPREGDDDSPSSSGALTPGKEGEGKGSNTPSPREPFEMSLEWTPDPTLLAAYAKRSGLAVSQFTPEAISGFVVHHDAKGLAQTEAQWVAALVGWVKRDIAQSAKVVRLRPSEAQGGFDDDDTTWLQEGAS